MHSVSEILQRLAAEQNIIVVIFCKAISQFSEQHNLLIIYASALDVCNC